VPLQTSFYEKLHKLSKQRIEGHLNGKGLMIQDAACIQTLRGVPAFLEPNSSSMQKPARAVLLQNYIKFLYKRGL
jgi:hypothetical protein